MADKWEKLFQDIVEDAGKLIKEEIREMLNAAKKDSEEYLRRQAEKIEKYLNQLAAGEIDKEQLKGYLMDIRALTEMFTLQLSTAARARAQRLTKGISDLIVDRLLALI